MDTTNTPTKEKEMTSLTPASLELFKELVEDAGNWSGSPLVCVSREERGNLTQLKRQGLIETFTDEGCAFATFTDKGKTFAAELGYDPSLLTFGF